jgi:ribosomal-protein-alanine N-acetyltransferase
MSSGELSVRRGQAADLDAIVDLERGCATTPHWAASVYAGIVERDVASRRCLFVAEKDGGVVGFAVGAMQADGVGELESVVVADAARRAGIGRVLCGAVIDWCGAQGAMEIALEVRAGSVGAIAFYQGLGFVRVGRRARYYNDPEDDALMMRLRADGQG